MWCFLQPGQRVGRWHGTRAAWLLFWVVMLLAMGFKSSLVISPILERPLPIEADDSFQRIFQAVRNTECLTQQCAALSRLREQRLALGGAEIMHSDYLVWEGWIRVSVLSDPWASLVIHGLHRLGMTLVDAHDLLNVLYPPILMGAVGYWLLVLFGPAPAGIALFFLMLMDFPGAGLNAFRPNEFVMALALICWAEIRRRGVSAARLMCVMIFIMSGWHLIGKLWSIVSLAAYLWHADRWPDRREWVWIFCSIGIVVLAFVLPTLIVPGVGIPTLDGLLSRSLLGVVTVNLQGVLKYLPHFVEFFKGAEWLVLWIGLGGVAVLRLEWQDILYWFVVLGSLLVLSLIDFHPAPAHLFARCFVPFAILFLGVIAYGIYDLTIGLVSLWRRIWGQRLSSENTVMQRVVFAGGFVILCALLDQTVFLTRELGVKQGQQIRQKNTERHDFDLPLSQPARLHHPEKRCQNVLYTNLTVLLYYLSYGAYDCGAVLPGESARGMAWNRENAARISHVVAWSPVRSHQGNLRATGSEPVVLEFEEVKDGLVWRLGLKNPGQRSVTVRVMRTDQGTGTLLFETELAPGWSGWVTVPNSSAWAGSLTLTPVEKEATILVTGLRRSTVEEKNSELRWPWNQGVSVHMPDAKSKGGRKKVDFSSRSLWKEGQMPMRIVDDHGSAVLAIVGEQ